MLINFSATSMLSKKLQWNIFPDKTRLLKCKLRRDHGGSGNRKSAPTVICTDFFKFAVKKQERAKDGKGCRNCNGGLRSLILTLGGDRIPWKMVYFCLHRRSTLAGMISMRAIRATLVRCKCFCACNSTFLRNRHVSSWAEGYKSAPTSRCTLQAETKDCCSKDTIGTIFFVCSIFILAPVFH